MGKDGKDKDDQGPGWYEDTAKNIYSSKYGTDDEDKD